MFSDIISTETINHSKNIAWYRKTSNQTVATFRSSGHNSNTQIPQNNLYATRRAFLPLEFKIQTKIAYTNGNQRYTAVEIIYTAAVRIYIAR
jgi:hypothetical protein